MDPSGDMATARQKGDPKETKLDDASLGTHTGTRDKAAIKAGCIECTRRAGEKPMTELTHKDLREI